MTASIPLLCLPPRSDEARDLGLPDVSDNISQRLIRNPHLESDTPRERECTEMLCSVLCNRTTLRLLLLRWLGELVGALPSDLDEMELRIDTEGSIGAKRDDLRIEGWRETNDGQELVLLWTVEVKVGAQFHGSSFQDRSDEASDTDD